MAGGLLDRMATRLRGERVATREESVLAHLGALLNTRQGSSALDADYGLPDITDVTHSMPAGIASLQKMIVDAIQRYEPRLRSIVVRSSVLHPDTLSLRFEVSAQLVSGGSLRFETKVSPGGHVTVA